ncbi:Lrp/AsnC family transcriptional regulator [Hyunsoonleella pacifica]|uniref:Lrp/AsnC family transcriptional regulator n=1 Tax=Hyunsoonleella pacifica TaxID=1080224 RepID=A0A4Q9FNM8_9FLAO|nr:Lrp/AsnC family transcriptional regulator [Hyunsoonleella pacifica]TBN15363.1 Lrp/AsnC family transcriptional regulator [Hyunsoonleella pacifica]GGD23430.1 AsnC family transcriptional regulator [Hyunsoonleella pacifica]
MADLDEIDLKILGLLQLNGKLTTKELAGQVHLSPTPVYERVRRLEREGIIKKYVALVEAEKVGKGLVVFCDITLKEHTKAIGVQFVKEIMSLKYVCECYNISGDYDFRLKVLVSDMKHYQDFVLNDLGSIKNIGSAHSTFVMGVIKQSFSVPLG